MSSLPEYQIREMREEDVPQVWELVRKLAQYEKLSGEFTATEQQYREHGFGENPSFRALVAERQEDLKSLLGFALYFFSFSTFTGKPSLYLEDLFVLPDFRGKGIGKALLKSLARIAVERDCGRMEWAVLDWNETAIRFYLKLGATSMHDWTVHRLFPPEIRRLADS